jgi:hypothetical protein
MTLSDGKVNNVIFRRQGHGKSKVNNVGIEAEVVIVTISDDLSKSTIKSRLARNR